MNDLMTIREVSEMLNVTLQTLRNWDKRGILTPIRTPSGQRRYCKNKIMELLGK